MVDGSCFHHLAPNVRADIAGEEVIGAARSRCDPGSRWVGYTFQRRDVGKTVKVGPGDWGHAWCQRQWHLGIRDQLHLKRWERGYESIPNRFMCQQFLLAVSWSRLKQHQRCDRCPTTRSWLMMFTWQTLIRPLRVGCWASTNMLKESDDIWCQWSHSGNLMSTGSIRIQKGSNNCALLIAGNGLAAPQSCSNNPPEYWQSRGYTCLTIDQAARIEISQIYP